MTTESTNRAQLFETLISRSDAELLMDRLDEALSGLFQVKESIEDKMGEIFSHKQKKLIMGIIEDEKIALTDLSSMEQLFRTIREEVSKIPVLELTLAVDPTEKLLMRIQEWVAENVNMKVLIDTRVNEHLIGGIKISINGYYHDYSLGKLLQSN